MCVLRIDLVLAAGVCLAGKDRARRSGCLVGEGTRPLAKRACSARISAGRRQPSGTRPPQDGPGRARPRRRGQCARRAAALPYLGSSKSNAWAELCVRCPSCLLEQIHKGQNRLITKAR